LTEKIKFIVDNNVKPVVLVAPLDWGLGHATRCIPVIHGCLNADFEVIIGASGSSYEMLKKEFPLLLIVRMPSYGLRYGKKRWQTVLKLLLQSFKILITINRESKWLKEFYKKKHLDIIISDNRFGLYHRSAYTIFITHQLSIKTPGNNWIEKMVQKINYRFINKFNHCWIPDAAGNMNLAGELSHPASMPGIPVTYLGSLSRIKKQSAVINNHLLILLSGPEPQRSILEEMITTQLKALQLSAIMVRGLPGQSAHTFNSPLLQAFDHLDSNQMQEMIARSAIIISRPGYSTVMDVLPMGKKCIFIPTPGQTEQEYLAAYLAGKGWCHAVSQDALQLKDSINKVESLVIPDLSFVYDPVILTRVIAELKKNFAQR
jgi:uncharacterized protein (TIGR00661 family)